MNTVNIAINAPTQTHAEKAAPHTHATPGFSSKSAGSKIIACLNAGARFYWNKLLYNPNDFMYDAPPRFLGATGPMEFFCERDEHGILRGGNLPWTYMQDITAQGDLTDTQKIKAIRQMLAKLPSGVAFTFKSCPKMRNLDVIGAAFAQSGFIPVEEKTHLFRGYPEEGDLTKRLKSDARSKTNAAARDLERADMTLDSFFDYYRENLQSAGKDSYFNLDIDRKLLELAVQRDPSSVHVIAVRRKSTDEMPGPHPVDAAIICLAGPDGYLKMMRITYRHEDAASPEVAPHKHATKLLMLEAMRLSIELGLTLDSDGSTPGSDVLYSRFGVFECVTRVDFHRKTAETFYKKPLNRLISKMQRPAKTPERKALTASPTRSIPSFEAQTLAS